MADSILTDKDKTLSSNQVIDTVVDFRVDVIGATRLDKNGEMVFSGVSDVFLASGP